MTMTAKIDGEALEDRRCLGMVEDDLSNWLIGIGHHAPPPEHRACRS
jgi:hypothetical protein